MSTRSRRTRGRAAKTHSLSTTTTPRTQVSLRKPRAYTDAAAMSSQSSEPNSRSSTPVSTRSTSSTPYSTRSNRPRTRAAAEKTKGFMQNVLTAANHGDEDDHDDDEVLDKPAEERSISDFDDDMSDRGSIVSFGANAENDDCDSDWSEGSFSTVSSTPSKRFFIRRPKSPEYMDEKDIPTLSLPASSTDLIITGRNLIQALGIYEVLRHFRVNLRLSPFIFENFCAALAGEEQSCLLAEIHITLLKALLREDDGNNTLYTPHDTKDSANICFFFLDAMTWYELVRKYLESDKSAEYVNGLTALTKAEYSATTIPERLQILQTLTDLFLNTNAVREEIMNEGNIRYDDHCRACHRLGDLLCCETCSAVYHLGCVEPPMEEVPEEDWQCSVCEAHQVPGVVDCISDAERSGLLCRQECIGYDRFRRKYWFLCRRLVVEGTDDTWYYSTPAQIEELLEVLDQEKWEKDLVPSLLEMRDEIERQMEITEDLTNQARGNRKSAIEMEITSLKKAQAERAEKKLKELEEKAAQEEEEQKQLEEKKQDEEDGIKKEEDIKEEPAGKSDDSISKGDGDSEMTDIKEEVKEEVETMEVNAVETTKVETSSASTVSESGDAVKVETTHEEVTVTTTVTTTKTTTVITPEGSPKKEEDVDMKEEIKEEPKEEEEKKPDENVKKEGDAAKLFNLQHVQSLFKNVKARVLKPGEQIPADQAGQAKKMMVINKDGTKTILTVLTKTESEEPDSDATSSQETTTSNSEASRRIVTRSKTGSLTPRQFQDSVTTTSLKTSLAKTVEESTTVTRDGEVTKLTRSKAAAAAAGIDITQQSLYFKLGDENSYKSYENQYATNQLALNKHQHNEDRQRRQQLSHRFSLTPSSEFKWNGGVYGTKQITIQTLRLSLIQFESQVNTNFQHQNWHIHRQNWIKAVNMCNSPQDFSMALGILEACIKPCLFNPVWHDYLGHTKLQRITAQDREEMKKRDKEYKTKRDEEELFRTTWAKYTLGLRHQVWKQKGEEYRIGGTGGWQWLSCTRKYSYVPQHTVGLRAVAIKLKARREKAAKKKAEEGKHTGAGDAKDEQEEVKMAVDKEEDKEKLEISKDNECSKQEDSKDSVEKDSAMDVDEGSLPEEETVDLIDVGEAMFKRTHYPRCQKPYSRLDLLLERRVKQADIEKKQKLLLSQVMLKFSAQEKLKQLTGKDKEGDDKVDVDGDSDKKRNCESPSLEDDCYSATCPYREDSLHGYGCYSPVCVARTSRVKDSRSSSPMELDKEDEQEPSKVLSNGPLSGLDEEDEDEEDEGVDVECLDDKDDDDEEKQSNKIKSDKSKPGGGGFQNSFLSFVNKASSDDKDKSDRGSSVDSVPKKKKVPTATLR